MNNYFKHHKQYQESINNKQKIFDNMEVQYRRELQEYLYKFKDARVLEIWCGMWKFTNFCNKIWVKDYTWIDIDDYFFEENKKDFPNYNFIKIWFQEYLKNHKNEFDIIFVSHVFEHLDEKERIEMIECIYNWLKKNWIRINYMPNADSIFRLWTLRRNDITHKTIYNDNSFSQVIYDSGCNFEIKNFSTYVYPKNTFNRMVHLIFLFFTKIFYLGMWYPFPAIYTFEIISVLKKLDE